MSRRTAHRQAAERAGRRAETLCAWSLRLRGWRLVARRARMRVGEIDLVMRRGGTLAFIEVKARPDLGAAAEAVTARQRERLARAAEAFLAGRPDLAALAPRFDVMLCRTWRWPVHIPNAWHILG